MGKRATDEVFERMAQDARAPLRLQKLYREAKRARAAEVRKDLLLREALDGIELVNRLERLERVERFPDLRRRLREELA